MTLMDVGVLLDDLGFSYLWNNSDITSLQLSLLIERVYDQYYQSWYAELNQSRKLLYYNTIKSQVGLEKYLRCVTNSRHRIELTKFRCSAHRLAIEEGRYRNIDRNERICVHCNMGIVEYEVHFLLVCPYYRQTRTNCLPAYYCRWPSLHKFKTLLKTENESLLKKISKVRMYCYAKTQ